MNALVPVQQTDYAVTDLSVMANAVAKSGLFGIKTPDQALALMLVAQAEGLHPASAARDYDIIQGRPAKKAEAMMRDFIRSGGTVKWHALDDKEADATFSHPQGGEVRISWDMKRATAAGLGGKDMWKKFPRQMLRSRVVSEGIRTVCPMATGGMYVPEEVRDFDDAKPVEIKDVTPKPPKSEPQRAIPQEARQAPPAENPVDRTADVVPTPDGDFPDDWDAYRKVIAAKINRAQTAVEVGLVQTANAAGLKTCGEILTDTAERIASLVDAKLAKLAQQEPA